MEANKKFHVPLRNNAFQVTVLAKLVINAVIQEQIKFPVTFLLEGGCQVDVNEGYKPGDAWSLCITIPSEQINL